MSVHSRAARFVVLVTALAVLNGAGAAASHLPPASADAAAEHCRTMRQMHAGMQHCQQTAMTCCRDAQGQPESSLPQLPASDAIGSAAASHGATGQVAPAAAPLHLGRVWFARPPTHGYSSQSLLVLQSVLLI